MRTPITIFPKEIDLPRDAESNPSIRERMMSHGSVFRYDGRL